MSVLDPATIDLCSLPSVLVQNKRQLPNCSAVYFVLSSDNTLLYVGRSIALQQRWMSHHIRHALRSRDDIRVAWLEVNDPELLPAMESAIIEYFQPPMNRETIALNGVSEYEVSHRLLVKRLNVNFSTTEEHLLLKQIKMLAVESDRQIRDVVMEALQRFVMESKPKK